jgi:hypothetical protein
MATTVDISDVLRGLDAMKARGMDLRPVFSGVRKALKDDQAEHFQNAEGPDGPWQPRAASTEARAAHQMLNATRRRGKLRGTRQRRSRANRRRPLGRFRAVSAYRFIVTRQSLEMRPRGPWAGVHQFGGVVGKGSVIPARPFLWASDSLVDAFEHALVGHLRGAW